MAEHTYGPYTETEARTTATALQQRGHEAYAVRDDDQVWYVWTTYEATPAERGDA